MNNQDSMSPTKCQYTNSRLLYYTRNYIGRGKKFFGLQAYYKDFFFKLYLNIDFD